MADTVHLPGLGDVKKSYAIAGGAAITLGFYVMYRRQQRANATAAAGANTGIDPATGYAFGSPEDAAALGNQQAYVNPTANAGGGAGLVSSGGGTLPQSFLTNAAWSQYVINYMTNNAIVQDNGVALTAALAVYLNGGVPTANETSLINQAVAIAGKPPIAGPNGYPPYINTGPPITQGPNPPTPTPTPTPTRTVILVDGTGVNAFLTKYNTTLDVFEQLNPGISQTIRETNQYGYVTTTNNSTLNRGLAFNVGIIPRTVRVPA